METAEARLRITTTTAGRCAGCAWLGGAPACLGSS